MRILELGVIVPDRDDRDDPTYLSRIELVMTGAIAAYSPETVFIVKITNWFGPRWRGFSHKVMGAFGVAFWTELVIPPFMPTRVVSERCYRRQVDGSLEPVEAAPLHVRQTSESNAKRKLRHLYPDAAFFWWTGGTLESGRGALMAYLPTPAGHKGWYAGLRRDGKWAWIDVRGASLSELRELSEEDGAP